PVAATGPTRGVYCSAIQPRLSPVRTSPPAAGRGAVATEADTPEPRSDATGLAWSTAHADSTSAALKVASAAAVLTWGSLRIRFSFRLGQPYPRLQPAAQERVPKRLRSRRQCRCGPNRRSGSGSVPQAARLRAAWAAVRRSNAPACGNPSDVAWLVQSSDRHGAAGGRRQL